MIYTDYVNLTTYVKAIYQQVVYCDLESCQPVMVRKVLEGEHVVSLAFLGPLLATFS
jgi:hypothetical protein